MTQYQGSKGHSATSDATLPASAQGMLAEALSSMADDGTRSRWRNARDRLSSQRRYDSAQGFLLVAGKWDDSGGDNCVEEGWWMVVLNKTEWPFPNAANAAVPPPSTPAFGLAKCQITPKEEWH